VADSLTIEEAFAICEARARTHYENFPVGLFVNKQLRRYVHALYAFMREADDFADEPRFEGERRERLDEWQLRLDAAYEGQAEGPVFVALAETIRRLDIPKQLLLDLLSAFRQDTEKRRYATWDEVIDYCRRSANPVGRLVLLVFGYRDEALAALSDCICTGLQLANHWQDLAIDLARERIYVPQDLAARFGVREDDLRASCVDGRFQALMRELVGRARALFAEGRPLCDRVGRDLRFEMRLTWLGGTGILDRIEAEGYDVYQRRPRWSAADKATLAWRAWRWPASSAA
jgi:squalene synthase HpnC